MISSTEGPKSDKKQRHWIWNLSHPVSFICWLYLLFNTFIYDIDPLLEQVFPVATWAIKWKFPVILAIIMLIGLLTGGILRAIKFLALIAFYPIILFGWIIPSFIWKRRSWNLAFAYINITLSFGKSFSVTFIIFSILTIASAMVLGTSNSYTLWVAITLLLVSLFSIYAHRILLIFKPSTLYQVHTRFTSFILNIGKKDLISSGLNRHNTSRSLLEIMSEKERKEIADRLQTAIILNRGCRFFSRKLEDYRKSRFTSFFYIVSFIALTVMSIIVFTFIYLALYKIQQNNFSFTSVAPSWFIFFYYSANTIFGQNINELIAAGTASRCMVLLERAFAFLLIIVLVSLVYSINSQRETEEINDAIKQIRGQGDEMESIIYRQYGFSITEAIAWLVSSNLASMIASKIIRYLSQFEEDIVKCENLDQSNED